MQNFFTREDVLAYQQKGIKTIRVDQMPILTDLAREALQTFGMEIVDYDKNTVLVECVKTEAHNNDMIELFKKTFINRVEVVRGGSVAIEAISTCVR